MALNKQPVNINFSKGVQTKADPFQLQPGDFLELENTIFTKSGQLTKRNGYGALTPLPDATSTFLTTYNNNLTAIGTSFSAYSQGSKTWINKGTIDPVGLNTLSLIRNNLNQTYADSAVAANNLVCTVYAETDGSTIDYKYVIADVTTSQNVVAPTPIAGVGTTTYTPKVFLLGRHFIIVFNDVVSAVNRLKFIAISTTTLIALPADELSGQYGASSTGSFDGVVANNNLYLAWNSNTNNNIRMTYLDSNLIQHLTANAATGYRATNVAIAADLSTSNPELYVATFDSATSIVKTFVVDHLLNNVLPAQTLPMGPDGPVNITLTAQNGVGTVICEFDNEYTYTPLHCDYLSYRTFLRAGSTGALTSVARSVGLASKAILRDNKTYMLAIYGAPQAESSLQPSYFLVNLQGQVICKVAYQEGGDYLVTGLPSLELLDDTIYVPYLTKTLTTSVNKNTNVPAGSQTGAIYSQLGVNLAEITFGTEALGAAEIGKNLHLTGGFLTMYDGYLPVEHNFFLYPENVKATWSATGGSIAAQPDGATNTNAYYVQAVYQWSDNQGNPFYSAPSVPVAVTTTGSASTGSITVNVPTLRLTYKIANPVKIVIYRWSLAQQSYYQTTSLVSPILNDTSIDSIQYVDTLPDADILGNSILYTTGGVIEDVSAPAFVGVTLFQSRMWGIDAEDQNLLWFSKQVIQGVPVEFSDLLTVFVAPTAGAQGDTGPMKVLCALDDKLIIFKKNAIYYINGQGPDNTGANNQFSEPVFITSTVGCANPNSIVFMPNGIMFQSDKGIWLLGRDLSTQYIGAPVEAFNDDTVRSAVNIAGTNQVRFTLAGGITLMYDYYFSQWGTFVNVPAISSVLYEDLHTYINSRGQVFQETPNKFLDGSNPVLVKFTTSWFNLAGLQGYQRSYFMYFLGVYKSPHKLQVQVAYDYKEGATQSDIYTPPNYSPNYGADTLWGGGTNWGGNSAIEQFRVFFNQQKCESFKVSVKEIYDPSIGAPAGAGLTLSGINLVIGAKRGYYYLNPKKSI